MAQLRRDRLSGAMVLLWPEHGLVLNRTAAELLELCTGALEVDAVVATLTERFGRADPAAVRVDILSFLRALDQRRLIWWER